MKWHPEGLGNGMGTITKALELLGYFGASRHEIGLSEFVRLTGRDKATVHRHLSELEENGFLEQRPDTRAYILGPALLRLSAVREAGFPVRKLLRPIVTDLSEAVGELAHASLLEGDALSSVFHADPLRHGTQVHFDESERLPLHATASGLACLAFASDALRERILSGAIRAYTRHTITDAAILREKLDEVRHAGMSELYGGFDEEVTSLAAPLLETGNRPIGAIAVAIPTIRAKQERLSEIAVKLMDASYSASHSLTGYHPKIGNQLRSETTTAAE